MTIVLKVSRALFTLFIGLTNAIAVFLTAIVPYYVPSNIVTPTIVLIDAAANVLIIYFTTEEKQIPTG